jgi:hypothetical protein
MPIISISQSHVVHSDALTILVEDVETLLHQQRRVQYNQAVAYGQHIVTCPGLQKGAYGPLLFVSAPTSSKPSAMSYQALYLFLVCG